MAVRAVSVISSIYRSIGLPAVQPLTQMASYYSEGSAAGAYRDLLSIHDTVGANEFVDPYVWVGLDTTDGRTLQLEVWNGTTSFVSNGPQITNGQPFHVALRITGNLHEVLYSNSGLTSDAAVVCSLNQANNIASMGAMYFYGEVQNGKIRITNAKVFTAAQTAAAIRLERDAYEVTDTANVYSAPRLRFPIDTTDRSGNNRNWSIIGAFEDTDGFPALGPTDLGAATNTSLATAIDMGTLPFHRLQDASPGSTTETLWFKYTPPAGVRYISVFGYGDATTYKPLLQVYLAGEVGYITASSDFRRNKPLAVPVTPGTTYYFKFSPNSGNPSPAVLWIDADVEPANAAPSGSLLVNDDTYGYPAALLDATTGAVRRFVSPFAAGESGAILPNGISLFIDYDGVVTADTTVNLYDESLDLIAILDIPVRGSLQPPVTTNNVDRFYLSSVGSGAGYQGNIHIVTDDGTHLGEVARITGAASPYVLLGMALSPDESIMYYSRRHLADGFKVEPVKRWNMVTNAAMSDLAPSVTNYYICREILCLTDGTVLASYRKADSAGGIGSFVRRYSAAGATLNTYTLEASVEVSIEIRLAHALDNPNSFWVWTKTEGGRSKFRNIRVSDGVDLVTPILTAHASRGVLQDSEATTMFAPSFSCAFIVMTDAIAATGGGGSESGGEVGGGGLDEDDDPTVFDPVGVIGPLVWVEWPRRIP